jgi:hypothetical protein
LAAASPFFGAGELTAILLEPAAWQSVLECVAWNTPWILVYGTTAGVLYLLTLATFDRSLGRMSAFCRGNINPFRGSSNGKLSVPLLSGQTKSTRAP